MSACGCAGTDLLPVDEAIAHLLQRVPTAPAVQQVALEQALSRVLAQDILSPVQLPAWDNSAMDGYALRAADLPVEGGYLPVSGRIAAGDGALQPLPAGQAVRIFTGAPLPAGADTVVPQERCRSDGTGVWFPAVTHGAHVRLKGEELRVGQPLLSAGIRLRPQELGLLASVGLAEVPVYRRLRVCLLSSGNELREPGTALAPGQIYNSNRYCLGALLRGLGCEVHDYGVMADELAASRDALSLAASEWDVLITSGGVSVGEEDHLKQAIRELGSLQLWRLAMQPGKPLAFGEVAGKPWIGLPGNPSAALVTALVVARPFLLKAQGLATVQPNALQLPADFDWLTPNSRRQYLRAGLQRGADGQTRVVLHPQQSSAMLSAACWADGLALVECASTLHKGDPVHFLPFAELLQ
jgi:molybdopterin molybdotransferase